jgi:hypothetical protein
VFLRLWVNLFLHFHKLSAEETIKIFESIKLIFSFLPKYLFVIEILFIIVSLGEEKLSAGEVKAAK